MFKNKYRENENKSCFKTCEIDQRICIEKAYNRPIDPTWKKIYEAKLSCLASFPSFGTVTSHRGGSQMC